MIGFVDDEQNAVCVAPGGNFRQLVEVETVFHRLAGVGQKQNFRPRRNLCDHVGRGGEGFGVVRDGRGFDVENTGVDLVHGIARREDDSVSGVAVERNQRFDRLVDARSQKQAIFFDAEKRRQLFVERPRVGVPLEQVFRNAGEHAVQQVIRPIIRFFIPLKPQPGALRLGHPGPIQTAEIFKS